jgi:hypothetical protein
MAENVERSRGRAQNYKLDRGGQPAEGGPFIGVVVNNVDNTRQGRLQVAIGEFGAVNKDGTPNLTDKNLWRTVSYCPPFYGATPLAQSGQSGGTSTGTGTYPGNRNTYGMWFTPPDVGVRVLCFFVNGDPNQGYYVGCIPDPGLNHMIPAIGAVPKAQYVVGNKNQETYFANSERLPVAEINSKDAGINDNPKFFDQPKPVHAFAAAVLFQQGLQDDPVRGSIGSSSQRESPSACYGFSTPGRPIFQGGADDTTIKTQLNDTKTTTASIAVIGRRAGHTFVLDDGDLEGKDNLIRIRTGKGHQITLSDDGNCLYICHANGQAWIELGQEGTLDVYATNSINLRTSGTLNLHADQDVNINAGQNLNIRANTSTNLQSLGTIDLASKGALTIFSESSAGIKSNTTLAIKSKLATIDGGSALSLKGMLLSLNGGPALSVSAPKGITTYVLPDTAFNNSAGWTVAPDGMESICTRTPTHEPWPYHNQGVSVNVNLQNTQTGPAPAAPAMPAGYSITKSGNNANAAQKAELQKQLVQAQTDLQGDYSLKAQIQKANNSAQLTQINQIIADRLETIKLLQAAIGKLG